MKDTRKKIALLGATGSIGTHTLSVLRCHTNQLALQAIAANKQTSQLAAIAREFRVPHVAIYDENSYKEAKRQQLFPATSTLYCGLEGLITLATLPDVDTLVMGIVGTLGLKPTLAAIRAGKTIALASKEVLVVAGQLVMAAAQQHNVAILPLDSEHNAIFQCLVGNDKDTVDKIILTASGGALRKHSIAELAHVTPEQAVKHPNWKMGYKVTMDCTTLANKGLEMIEARWLFDLSPSQIDVVVHPQSIVHSMVQFVDGAVLAQLGHPCMTIPIQYSLLYPERKNSAVKKIDFSQGLQLDFVPPDYHRFPCLRLAQEALRAGGGAPAVFNAANEVAVDHFLQRRVRFLDIPTIIDKTLNSINQSTPKHVDAVFAIDQEARVHAHACCNNL